MIKDYSISFIRLFSMLLIITCHICQYYNLQFAYVLNVGVQIFLIISGYLYGNKNIQSIPQFIFKQFKKILIPYYTFLLIAIALYLVYHPLYLDKKVILYSFLTIGEIQGLEHLWFIRYILLSYCIIPFLNIIRDKIQKVVFLIAAALAIMISIQIVFTSCTLFTGMFINCFVFGYFLRNIEYRCTNNNSKNIIYLFILSVAVVVNIVKLLVIINFIPELLETKLLFSLAHLLLGATIFIVLHKFIRIDKYYNVLKLSDKLSYPIYLVHQFFILSPFTILAFTDIKVINIILVYISSFLGGYILCKIYNPIMKRI